MTNKLTKTNEHARNLNTKCQQQFWVRALALNYKPPIQFGTLRSFRTIQFGTDLRSFRTILSFLFTW